MGLDSYRAELARLQKEAAALQKELAKYEEAASKARAAANAKRKSAASTKSVSMSQSYLRAAEAEDKNLVAATKRVGEIQDKLATNAGRQRDKQRSLDSALKAEQTTRDRSDEHRRRKEKDHAREIARLSRPSIHHVYIREPEPEKLRVLYLTASPPSEEQDALRVDAEVNNVLKALRGAKHRDLIDVRHRPAATPQDLVDGINDFRPHVIHFSGHAGTPGLLFDNASLTAPEEQMVGYGTIARLLGATDAGPMLVVLNACDSSEGALELLDSVPIVIAMSAPVGDASAGVFATQFYAAIGGAQSVGHAVDQAVAMTELALQADMDLVTVCARDGVEPKDVKLVRTE